MSHELNWPVNQTEVGEKSSCVRTRFHTAETTFKQNERRNIFTSKDEYFDYLMEYNTKTGNYFSLTTYKALLSEQSLLCSL